MKKVVICMLCLFAVILEIKADNDRITTDINELPEQSQEFLQKWFGGIPVSHIKIDRNMTGTKGYDVLLSNGVEIEFNRSGEWTEIDGNRVALPEGIISQEWQDQIDKLYPGQRIMKIEKEGGDTNVKLSNRLEITFNRQGKVVEVDD